MADKEQIRFIVDEDFNNDILRGLVRHQTDLDIVRIQDVGLASANDPIILAWAAQEKRVLLTHDVSTMTHHTYQRIRTGKPLAGVIFVPQSMPIGQAIEDIFIVITCSSTAEWKNQILFPPL